MASIFPLDSLSEFQTTSPVPFRPHRTRSASINSDRYSVSEVGDSKSTPQLLGTMGKATKETYLTHSNYGDSNKLGLAWLH